jgi:hypothetical protein
MEAAGMDETNVGGYSVAYGREETEFPVYLLAVLSAVLLAAGLVTGSMLWLVLGVIAAAITYYNFPLLEKSRPTLGANEYGVFVQGFGLIRWRAIDRIDLVAIADRFDINYDLQIALNMTVTSALVADWRKQPFYRSLMRIPWSMTPSNVVRINIDPFNHPPDEIHRTLMRMWRHYRS